MRFMVTSEGGTYYLIRDIHDNKHHRIKYSRKQFFQARRGFRPEVMEYIRKCQSEYYGQIKIVAKGEV